MANFKFNGGEWQIKWQYSGITIQWQTVEIKVKFNDMSFEQSVLHLRWISLDWWSLGKRVIKWGCFNKTDIFSENNLGESNK